MENLKYIKTTEFTPEHDGVECIVRLRFCSKRRGKGVTFLTFRERGRTIQVVLDKEDPALAEVRDLFTGKMKRESIVDIQSVIHHLPKPEDPEAQDPKIASCDIGRYELLVRGMKVVSMVEKEPAIDVLDAGLADTDPRRKGRPNVLQETRLNNRPVDLRTKTNIAIFSVKAAVAEAWREYFRAHGFTEIHTPKLISGASEGGANVFTLKYFGKTASLAQSPQLYKQQMIVADFGRVFEVAPVFRAENSQTHRHLTEFIGLDMEMAFTDHYHEVLTELKGAFVHIFNTLTRATKTRLTLDAEPVTEPNPCRTWIDEIHAQYTPADGQLALRYPQDPNDVLVLPFWEAIDLVAETFPDHFPSPEAVEAAKHDDFDTPTEKKLGVAVAQKYGVDFYIVDKFPAAARPFYTMPDAAHPGYTNSYDVFVRGEEITSGAQRIHTVPELEAYIRVVAARDFEYKQDLIGRAGKPRLDKGTPEYIKGEKAAIKEMMKGLKAYVDAFRSGCPPHGGAGVGLERLVMLFLGLDNCRKTSLFPRDPTRLTP